MSEEPLRRIVGQEMRRGVAPAVAALAAQLAARAGGAAVAVLYYGSNLREERLDGVLDFYVLLDRVGAWPGPRLAALANRVLPPNVGYLQASIEGQTLRAKYALLSLAQFRRGVRPEALDTTLWARFCQPCACAWARSAADFELAIDAVRQAVLSAACWAARLGPERGAALDYWRALFFHTYGAELRVEQGGRSDTLIARDARRYAELLPQAWCAAGIDFRQAGDAVLVPQLAPRLRAAAARRWALRRRLGKPLNLLRLLKAAFTFDGAMDYVTWKVERHTGLKLEVAAWQRRHPLLAAPGLYRQLRKLGLLR